MVGHSSGVADRLVLSRKMCELAVDTTAWQIAEEQLEERERTGRRRRGCKT